MTLTSSELWKRIVASGLATDEQTRGWAGEVAQSLSAAELADGRLLLKKLVADGKVTPFQAESLQTDTAASLKRGIWRIRGNAPEPLWRGWFEAEAAGQTRYVQWLDQNATLRLKAFHASWNRAETLCRIAAPGLFPLASIASADGAMQLVHPIAEGSLLNCKRRADASTIIHGLAGALAALHSANIVHGRVMPDRLLEMHNGSLGVIADPICGNTSRSDESGSCGVFPNLLDSRTPEEQFLAPEFNTPGQKPTMATDVYALGCLWWLLSTGKPIVAASDTISMMSAHCEALPALPANASLADGEAEVLRSCLGRNLDSRFRNAGELLAALAEVRSAHLAVASEDAQPEVHSKDSAKPLKQADAPQKPAAKPQATTSEKPVAKAKQSKAAQPTRKSEAKSKSQPEGKAVAKAVVKPSHSDTKSAASVTGASPVKATKKVEPDPATQRAAPPAKRPNTVNAEPQKAKTTPAAKTESEQKAPKRESVKKEAAKPLAQSRPEAAAEQPAEKPAEQLAENGPIPAEAVEKDAPRALKPTSKKAPSSPAANSEIGRKGSPARKKRKRKKGNSWILPVAGGCGFIILLLAILKLSGALEPGAEETVQKPAPAYVPSNSEPTGPTEPTSEYYVQRASDSGNLWMPPRDPSPWSVDHLPPGAQMFVHVKPAFLNSDIAKLAASTESWIEQIQQDVAVPLAEARAVNVAFYPPTVDGGQPIVAYRVSLREATTLEELGQKLSDAPPAQLAGQKIFASDRLAFWPHVDEQGSSATGFTVASIEQMKEAIDLGGEAAPMLSDVENLWELSDEQADMSVLLAPAFLFSNGRRLSESMPPRLSRLLSEQLEEGVRSAMLQISLDEGWYSELFLIGESPTAAAVISQDMADQLKQLPTVVEDWFVDQAPDPHWAAIAFRFPQMLRAFASFTRTGMENGVAITNTYLPRDAAANLVLATSIAMQPTATVSGGPSFAGAAEAKPLSTEEYLNRKIRRINFAQEPIEVALEYIGDEANDSLPNGTPKFAFILDGDAFEAGGITRNQQLSDFDFSDISVRDALTEVAKRGNPVTTVTDTREADQRLIWIVRDAETAQPKILLTTRAAAAAAGDELTIEFRPE